MTFHKMARAVLCAAFCLLPSLFAAEGPAHRAFAGELQGEELRCTYLGIENYGSAEVCKANLPYFRYRFLDENGTELVFPVDNGSADENGRYAYPIQNTLKEGYEFLIRVENGVVVQAQELVPESGVDGAGAPVPGPESAFPETSGEASPGQENDSPSANVSPELENSAAAPDGLPGQENSIPSANVSAAPENSAAAPDGLSGQETCTPPVSGTPGLLTLGNFLRTALEPMGTALYIYGGGWDWQDEGAGPQTRSLGVSPDWVRFFDAQDENFTYKDRNEDPALRDPAHSFYPFGEFNEYYYAGLDCSGYVGWAVYNLLETEDGNPGYVGKARSFALDMSERGYGSWVKDFRRPDGSYDLQPGDIVSNNTHVFIILGCCADGSIVIAHSVQSLSRTGQPGGGVQLTALGYGEDCEAYRLADAYMSAHCPEWYRRYPAALRNPESYLPAEVETAGRFRWSLEEADSVLSDPEGLSRLPAAEVLEILVSG